MTAVLKDLLAPDLSVLFCGSAVGTASARRGAYYAGPGNAFWKSLFEAGMTPRQLKPEEYERLLQYRFGLTDLAKSVSGSDNILADAHLDRDGLTAKILRYKPRIVAFTGKRAAREFLRRDVAYGPLEERVGRSMLFVLPSLPVRRVVTGASNRGANSPRWHARTGLAAASPLTDRQSGFLQRTFAVKTDAGGRIRPAPIDHSM